MNCNLDPNRASTCYFGIRGLNCYRHSSERDVEQVSYDGKETVLKQKKNKKLERKLMKTRSY